MSWLYFASVIVSIYLLLLLIGKPDKTTADKILTAWQLFATLHLADLYFVISGRYHQFPYLLGWSGVFPLLHGPFLYLYILHLTAKKRLGLWWLLHFLPVVLISICWLPFLLLPSQEKIRVFDSGLPAFSNLAFFTNITIIVSGVSYITASAILLYRFKRQLKEEFSNTEKISLNWLRYLIGGMGIIWLFVVFYQTPQTIYLSASLFICFIGFFGVRQKTIFKSPVTPQITSAPEKEMAAPVTPSQPVAIKAPITSIKYKGSTLTEDNALKIQEQLKELMEREQLYTNPELTLGDVARTLEIHDAILSQVINSKFGQNFYDYINSLRVEAFKKIVAAPGSKSYTLLSIAFECGFNSKSSFNRNFRKFTGQQPSAYLKDQSPSS
ncbi:helix-turn-helix domain-containing protein [Chitinophaga arvensicola]|uniref:AraC-type DNA-binding protein n=1 Tax=Chitinophaga arvensicola TaxID=29529 RepID=A0A1I0SDR3_9BACT|nr:AraC family transcriptional regulator [Chitinophaga arvensicola]SEW56395.1 AraC-type DNA-binding protein [Chitinophaga arvensicola]